MIRLLNISILLLLALESFGQITIPETDTFPILRKDFKKTSNWLKADSNRNFYYSKYDDTMNIVKAVRIIKSEKNFYKFLQAKTYCIDNFKESISLIISMLTDTTKVGLINTADLIIWDRLKTNELKFYGHGGSIDEDIFTVAGRCSYILNELTDENFAQVHVATTLNELTIYQSLWKSWFRSR